MKRALITGYTGQDGSYLAELLLGKGYQVFGLVRRSATPSDQNVAHLAGRVEVVPGDLTDQASLLAAVETSQPDEVYNLGAQSFVGASWGAPEATAQVTALGALRLLEAVRAVRPGARFYQASSSEMFGLARPPQSEATPFYPRSPYGVSKLYAHWATVNARESYRLFACSGILFNHESPRRGHEFVTRKVARAAARISRGFERTVRLGNLDARRDWGFAGDYVEAMWRMLQEGQPADYVIGTGQTQTVRELVRLAFDRVGLDYHEHVELDDSLVRPAEVPVLLAGATLARSRLGWEPKVTFAELVAMMVDAELALLDGPANAAGTLRRAVAVPADPDANVVAIC